MQYQELTRSIIGAAYHVHNAMGYGFVGSVYEKCMVIELDKRGLDANDPININVHDEGHPVGQFTADLFVDRRIIVELKSIEALAPIHEVQLVNYLTATQIDIGLLINFGPDCVEIRRKVRNLGQLRDHPPSSPSC